MTARRRMAHAAARQGRARSLLAASIVGLAGAAALVAARPATAAATIQPAEGDLARDFRLVRATIEDAGGFLDRDRPVLRRFLDRTAARLAEAPNDVDVAAMDLQVAIWLDEDRDRIRAGFDRLASLLPGDPQVGLARLNWRESVGELDDAEAISELERLAEQDPSDEVLVALAPRLIQEARNRDVIDLLAPRMDDTESVQLQVLYGEALFNANRFAEAAAVAESADWRQPGALRMKDRVEQLTARATEHVAWWEEELAIRAAEAEADDLPRVALQTARGRIVIELFENEAPNTVANFVTLAESDFYDGTRFHRFEPDFMIQGGDPLSRPDADGTPGTGGPGYTIPDEHGDENDRRHFGDSVSMANTGQPNSGGSQFFLNHRPTSWLNGRHTVFGRIVEGLDVAHALRKDDELVSVEVLRKRDHDYTPETIPDPSAEPESDAAEGDGATGGAPDGASGDGGG